MLHGALAASVTPLREHGSALDDDAFGPLVDFYVDAGLDGILALGTAGEGILLGVEERRRVADLFLQAADRRLQVAVHCGAQTTADTVTLAAHAAEVGADAVVVIGPPYFVLDEKAQYAHFLAAATACAPLPFYVYEFAGDDRLCRRAGRARTAEGGRAERRRAQGVRHAVRAFRAVPPAGLRHLRRPGGADRAGMARGARSARSRRSPRRSRARSPRSFASRAAKELRVSASSAHSSSASRARRHSSGCSRSRASQCEKTFVRRFAGSPSRSATSSTPGRGRCSTYAESNSS